jgi:hypothetical protein
MGFIIRQRLVKTQQTKEAQVCVLENCNVYEFVKVVIIIVIFCKRSINSITNPTLVTLIHMPM